MVKRMLIIICLVSILFVVGCQGSNGRPVVKIDGIFLGAVFMDAEIETDTPFGRQSTRASGIMPIGGIILKFE